MDEIIGHLREGCRMIPAEELTVSNRRIDRRFNGTLAYAVQEGNYVPEYAPFGEGDHFNVTGLFHDLDGFPTMIIILRIVRREDFWTKSA